MGEKANDRNTCHTMSIIITSKEQNTHDDTLLLTLLEAFQQQKKSISSLYSTSLPQKRKWDLFSLLKEASLLFQVVLGIACCWSFGLFKPLWNHTHKILYSTLERSCLLLHHSNFLLGLPLLTDPYCSRSFVLYSNYSDVLVRLLFMMQQFLETLILKNGFDELNFSLHHPWE